MKKIVIVIFLGDSVAGEDHLRRHQPPDRGKQRSIGTRSLLPAPPLRFGRPLPVSHGAEAHRHDYAPCRIGLMVLMGQDRRHRAPGCIHDRRGGCLRLWMATGPRDRHHLGWRGPLRSTK